MRPALALLLLFCACSRKPETVKEAAAKGGAAGVRALAARRPEVVKGAEGKAALLSAVKAGDKELAAALVETGAPVREAAQEAAQEGETSAVLGILDLSEQVARRGGAAGPLDASGRRLAIFALNAASGAGKKDTAEALKKLVMSLPDRQMGVAGPQVLRRPSGQPGALEDGLEGGPAARPQAGGLPRRASPLLLAAARGDVKKVRELVAAGEKLEDEDVLGRTALMLASEGGHTGTVLVLLELGADLEAVNKRAPPGLLGVVLKERPDAPQADAPALLAVSAPPPPQAARGANALMTAAGAGRPETVLALLDKGASLEAPDDLGQTALMYAAAKGGLKAVVTLLNRGARVDAAEKQGWTPLMIAAARGRDDVVAELLKRKPKLDAVNSRGQSALMAACAMAPAATVERLLAAGADTELHDGSGQTALHYAAASGRADVIRKLLAREAHAEARTEAGVTALMAAAQSGSAEAIKALLETPRTKLEAATKTGVTALMYAAASGKEGALKALLDAGAAVDAREREAGWTALMIASAKGRTAAARLLLSRGADASARDARGRTAAELSPRQ